MKLQKWGEKKRKSMQKGKSRIKIMHGNADTHTNR